jgi:hypothetical protein
MSMILKFSFSRDISCENNFGPRSLSRIMVLWPEGHGLCSSAVGYGCSVSLESRLGEMSGEMNFTSLDGLWLG